MPDSFLSARVVIIKPCRISVKQLPPLTLITCGLLAAIKNIYEHNTLGISITMQ